MKEGYTGLLAEYIAGTAFQDIPQETIIAVKLHLLDGLGIALGAYSTGHPLITNLIGLTLEMGGKGEVTILGAGGKVPSPEAAFVNGVLANFLDYSDGHFMGGHINDRLVPVALAAAERVGASGKELLTALTVGYEIYIELAYALFPEVEPASVKLPYFVMLGPLAGAATAGKLLGLAEAQIAGALGLAASIQLGGAQYVPSGGHEKDLSSGHEARRGLLAALLAQRGILGSHDILEGERGIFRAIGGEPPATVELGRRWRIAECYFKPYPACRYLHASIEAALNLVREHEFDAQGIEKVMVSTNTSSASRVSYVIKSHVNAIFSHAYQVAAALRYGRVDLPTTWEEKVRDPLFTSLMRRVEVQATPEYDQLYLQRSLQQPPWPAEVEVQMPDGKRYHSRVLSPRGDPTNPLTPAEVRAKFTDLTGKVLPNGGSARVIELVDRLEAVPNVSELTRLLIAARAH